MGIFFLILIALVYISYQLYRQDKYKKRELLDQAIVKEEEKIREAMPHLFKKSISDDQKKELVEFYYLNKQYGETGWDNPYVSDSNIESMPPREQDRLRMEKIKDEEKDVKKKELMEKSLQRSRKLARKLIDELTTSRETTMFEREFVIWRFYKNELKAFPSNEDFLDDVMVSSYIEAFPKLKSKK